MSKMWSDAPIESAQQDAFGRANYAGQIANLIDNAGSGEESVVFGLTGPWGIGKSSMLAMVEEALEQRNSSWYIARFTPWATSDVNGLFTDFHVSLYEALPKHTSKKLQKSLGTLLQVSAPVAKFIPLVGESIEATAKLAANALQQQPSWNKTFQEVSDALSEQQIRVLVITDDIDRLHGEELLALLKVVRLLGRFPGVHFLLAYDEETIAETIAQSGLARDNGTGRRFMEKIVQYPLPIPPLTPTQLLSKLDIGITEHFKEFKELEHFKIRITALRGQLLSVLSTPRAIDRFLAQLNHTLAMFDPREVELGDVVILTLIKVSYSSVFNELPRFKNQLISGMRNGENRGFLDKQQVEFNLDLLCHRLPEESIEDAKALIQELFPAVRKGDSKYWLPPNEKSISKPEYFDRYFVMGIPDYDIPDSVVTAAIDNVISGDRSQVEMLLTTNNDERAIQILEKAEHYSLKFEEDDKIIQLLGAILPPLETLPRESDSIFSAHNRIRNWGATLLARLSDDVSPYAVLGAFKLITNLRNQIEVLRSLLAKTERKPWLDDAIELVGENIIVAFIQNLSLQDEAPADFEMLYFITILSDWQMLEKLREKIRVGLSNNDFAEIDVAARCVEYGYGAPSEPFKTRLIRFSEDIFESILPNTSLPRSGELPEQFDKFDLSWENRRLFAKSLPSSTS